MTEKNDSAIEDNETEALVTTTKNGGEGTYAAKKTLPKRTTNRLVCLGILAVAFCSPFVWWIGFSAGVVSVAETTKTQQQQQQQENNGTSSLDDEAPVVPVDKKNKKKDNDNDATTVGNDKTDSNGDDRQSIVDRQIASFRNGTGLLVNLHITHHGGTTVCGELGHKLRRPTFACMGPKDDLTKEELAVFPRNGPWEYKKTGPNIDLVKRHYDFFSWEYRNPPGKPAFLDTNWEHPNLVSMIVMREPISRSLAGDGVMVRRYPTIWDKFSANKNGSLEEWWKFCDEKVHNNNYALRILSSNGKCCQGNRTSVTNLEKAKELVKRFTFVIDINCLGESLDKLAEILGIELQHNLKSANRAHKHKSLEERVPYPEVLQFLKEKNKLDIELYEWSKSRSLVKCDSLGTR